MKAITIKPKKEKEKNKFIKKYFIADDFLLKSYP